MPQNTDTVKLFLKEYSKGFIGLIHGLASLASIGSLLYVFYQSTEAKVDERILFFTKVFLILFVLSFIANFFHTYYLVQSEKRVTESEKEKRSIERDLQIVKGQKEGLERDIHQLEQDYKSSVSIYDLNRLFKNGYETGFKIHKKVLQYSINRHADILRDSIISRINEPDLDLINIINGTEIGENRRDRIVGIKRRDFPNFELNHSEHQRERKDLFRLSANEICNCISDIVSEDLDKDVGVILIRTIINTRDIEEHNNVCFEVIGYDELTARRSHFNKSSIFRLSDVTPIEDLTKQRDEIDSLYIDSVKNYRERHGKEFKNSYNPNHPQHYDSIYTYPLISQKRRKTLFMPEGFLWLDCLETNAFDQEFQMMIESLANLCYSVISPINEYEVICQKADQVIQIDK